MGFAPGRQIGLIAQEVEKVVPEIVRTGEDGFKAVSYEKLVPMLIEAVKAQQVQIEALQAQLDALKGVCMAASRNELPDTDTRGQQDTEREGEGYAGISEVPISDEHP